MWELLAPSTVEEALSQTLTVVVAFVEVSGGDPGVTAKVVGKVG